jgi:hypothetical protein
MRNLSKALPLLAMLLVTMVVWAASPERYLHVKVTNPGTHELVRVNLPLSFAEKVIPAINDGDLRNGKVQVGNFSSDKVNVRQVLEAVKTAPDGEFVTVEEPDNNVRVAKEHGQLVVHVIGKRDNQNVDVTIPWEVAEALVSDTNEDQLNVLAAVKALEKTADATLVTVTDHEQSVRVWIDSNSSDK